MKNETPGAQLRHLDLYGLLGVSSQASTEEIRRAYRRAALACHPDQNPNDEQAAQRFVLITQARDVLIDGPARRSYDELRAGREVRQESWDEPQRPARKRGTRRTATADPLSEQRLAARAQRSRSAAELTSLWNIGSVVVRAAILRNVACPVALFSDPHVAEHWLLGLEAANRAQCPPAVLAGLASSFERSVAMAVALHPATPAEALLIIATRHRDLAILGAVAAHATTDAAALREVARAVRGPRTLALASSVLSHPACPPDVAQRIRARLGAMVA